MSINANVTFYAELTHTPSGLKNKGNITCFCVSYGGYDRNDDWVGEFEPVFMYNATPLILDDFIPDNALDKWLDDINCELFTDIEVEILKELDVDTDSYSYQPDEPNY